MTSSSSKSWKSSKSRVTTVECSVWSDEFLIGVEGQQHVCRSAPVGDVDRAVLGSRSLVLGQGLPAVSAALGSVRVMHLVVDDIDEARPVLVDRGVDVYVVADLGGGVRMAGFADPDGNPWTLQELP